MKRGFQVTRDDDDLVAVRKVAPNRYHFIRVIDMEAACGRDNEGQPRYVAELDEVDLDSIPVKRQEEARKSCGWEGAPDTPEVLAEMLYEYGARASLLSESIGARLGGFRKARKLSYELTHDEEAWRERLQRQVNRIGSTALEAMQGDFTSAMQRGVEHGDREAKLMAKIHGVPDDVIAAVEKQGSRGGVRASIRLHHPDLVEASGNDPLAYTMGYMHGMAGAPLESNRKELAKAYLDGFKLGVAVRVGEAARPSWAA